MPLVKRLWRWLLAALLPLLVVTGCDDLRRKQLERDKQHLMEQRKVVLMQLAPLVTNPSMPPQQQQHAGELWIELRRIDGLISNVEQDLLELNQ